MHTFSTPQELQSLLHVLRGEHRMSRGENILSAVLLSVIPLICAMLFREGIRQAPPLRSVEGFVFLVAVPLFGIAFIVFILITTCQRCVFAHDQVALKRTGNVFGWTTDPTMIRTMCYRFEHVDVCSLSFGLQDGTTKKMICTKSMREIIEAAIN